MKHLKVFLLLLLVARPTCRPRYQRDEARGTVSKDQRGRGGINAPTRTRQASSQCLNRQVVLFLYDEQQSPLIYLKTHRKRNLWGIDGS
jgi:hypothetical protein